MQNKAIIKEIDNVGRVVLPKEFRELLDVHGLDEVEISVWEGGFVVKPVK